MTQTKRARNWEACNKLHSVSVDLIHRLDRLQDKIRRRGMSDECLNGFSDWADVGSLNQVSEKLAEIEEFLG